MTPEWTDQAAVIVEQPARYDVAVEAFDSAGVGSDQSAVWFHGSRTDECGVVLLVALPLVDVVADVDLLRLVDVGVVVAAGGRMQLR